MADQHQNGRDRHPQHPPEKKNTRRRTDMSNTSTKSSIFTLNKFRRSHTHDVKSGPLQESFSCYAGLTWDTLRGYLEKKWPGRVFTEDKVRDKYTGRYCSSTGG